MRREGEGLHRVARTRIEVAADLYSQTRLRLSAGQQIGRYRIIGLLGAGGMGEVYRAVDTQLEREVAIKILILPPGLAAEPEALAIFKREAQTVAALSHPNILALYDFGFDQGLHFAVMELLEGETLASRLSRGPLDWRQAVQVAMGRVDEALVESRRAYELDPLSLSVNLVLGGNLYTHGDYTESIDQLRKTLELDPNFVSARIHLVLPLLELKKFNEAIVELNQLKIMTHGAPPIMALLGNVYARSGKRQEALDILAALTSKRQHVANFDLAALYFGLGDKDRAFEYLNKACEERDPLITLIKVEPFWAPLRPDPRFQVLVRRMFPMS
jgi:hypothetical protein